MQFLFLFLEDLKETPQYFTFHFFQQIKNQNTLKSASKTLLLPQILIKL